MLKTTKSGLIAVFCALLLAGCGLSGDATIEVKEDKAGNRIDVTVGQNLLVNLHGNPTTGYEWVVDAVDATILAQDGKSEFHPDSNATGSGGQVLTRFKALVVGQTTLKMVYKRSWEANKVPIENYQITVNIVQK